MCTALDSFQIYRFQHHFIAPACCDTPRSSLSPLFTLFIALNAVNLSPAVFISKVSVTPFRNFPVSQGTSSVAAFHFPSLLIHRFAAHSGLGWMQASLSLPCPCNKMAVLLLSVTYKFPTVMAWVFSGHKLSWSLPCPSLLWVYICFNLNVFVLSWWQFYTVIFFQEFEFSQ